MLVKFSNWVIAQQRSWGNDTKVIYFDAEPKVSVNFDGKFEQAMADKGVAV